MKNIICTQNEIMEIRRDKILNIGKNKNLLLIPIEEYKSKLNEIKMLLDEIDRIMLRSKYIRKEFLRW